MIDSDGGLAGGSSQGAFYATALIDRERRVLNQIATGIPLNKVLEDLLLAVEATAESRMMASVLFVSEDGRHLLHGAGPSLPPDYNAAIHGIAIGEGVGSCGTAVARGGPVYANDLDTDPNWKDFRELALGHGLRACWSTPIRTADGRILGTFAVYYDKPRSPTPEDIEVISFVTQTAALAIERHLSEERIKRGQDDLRKLNETLEQQVQERTEERDRAWRLSQELLVVALSDGSLEAVNASWTRILGWDAAELLSVKFEHLTHPDDLQATMATFAGVFERPLTDPYAYRLRHKDGSWRWFAWTAVFEAGKVYASGRDITIEREQADALRQSQKMEAVGQLTGGIAHDFNNMLAVVMGSLDLLKRRLTAADVLALRYIEAAMDGARRSAQLTQRLLAFARRQPLKPEAVDVNRLVAGMSELIRGSLGSDIRMETVLSSGLWRVHADPNQLENVLLNIAVNARDAMPEGGRLTVETQNTHLDERYAAANVGVQSGQYVLIATTDTGGGMAEDVLAKAFDPFFTTKDVGKGTGLGLSQVYGFVKQSGGNVKIYSEKGHGTTVKIYLPRLVGQDVESALDPSAFDLPEGDGEEVILVVEDEPAVRQFAVDALRELGYLVIETDGAASALRILETRQNVALLFTDIIMPDMNGAKLAAEARRRWPALKVLFMTGYTRNAVVHNGVVDPGVELIGKPFSVDELAARVRLVLDKA